MPTPGPLPRQRDSAVAAAQLSARLLVRVASLPTRVIEAMHYPELGRALAAAVSADTAIEAERERVSDLLYTHVGAVDDRVARGALLKVRRALYRGVLPPSIAMATALSVLPDDVRATVANAIARVRARDDATIACRRLYGNALQYARHALRTAITDDSFQAGVLISSPTLFERMSGYMARSMDERAARDNQIERGILRYFTRAVMKATPFARFCAVTVATFTDVGVTHSDHGPARNQNFSEDPSLKRSYIRLNKRLYSVFWNHLKTRAAVREALRLEVNPTLIHDARGLRFLAAIGGREVFQAIARNDALDLVLEVTGAMHSSPTYGDVVSALATHSMLDATVDQARAYVDALMTHGLLRFRGFVPEQTADWDIPLRNALLKINDEHAALCAVMLGEVRALVDAYADALVDRRREINRALRSRLLESMAALGIPPRLPRELALFEDASTSAELKIPRNCEMDEALADLSEWVALTSAMTEPEIAQASLRHFFDTKYSDYDGGVTTVPLLRFYEDYYRDHRKAHLAKQEVARRDANDPSLRGYDLANPFGLAYVRNARNASSKLTEAIRAAWSASPDAVEVSVSPGVIRECVGADNRISPGSRAHRSASMFSQLATGAATTRIFVPGGRYHVGYGKYFSRFLYTLPSAFTDQLCNDNAQSGDGAALAEICGDAQFNANLHPPLLPFEVTYPSGDANSAMRQFASADLEVLRDPDNVHALALRHGPTGIRVLPIDLGFLTPRMRPPLFQLLLAFQPAGSYGAILPEVPNSDPTSPPPSRVTATDSADGTVVAPDHAHMVRYRPRILLGDRIVIARRRWTVPGAAMPQCAPTEAAADYMLRVERWRQLHGIPAEVYVRVIPEPPRRAREVQIPGTGAADLSDDGVGTRELREQSAEAETWPEPCDDTADDGEGVAEDESTDYDMKDGHTPPVAGETPPALIKAATGDLKPQAVAAAIDGGSAVSRDHRKPQYIHFQNPLLLDLLSRLPVRFASSTLVFEERYPDAADLPRFGDDTYVSELVIQVNCPELSLRNWAQDMQQHEPA